MSEETQRQEGDALTQTPRPVVNHGDGEPIHLISLGAGVQSSTMALMAAHGEILPMPKAAIFADTQDEPESVYRWLDWLEKQLPFPVHRVTAGKLSEGALKVKTSAKGRRYSSVKIPLFTRNADGSEGKIVHRGCTRDFKIYPVHRAIRRIAGIRRGQKDIGCIEWIGISLDEQVRMKLSRHPWLKHRWPLVDMRLSRHDCLNWMLSKGYPKPPRSACVYCPFHSNAEWRRLRDEEPEAFNRAVEFERNLLQVQTVTDTLKARTFLHRSLVPLDKVDFSTDIERGQSAWWEEEFRDECEGMCGV